MKKCVVVYNPYSGKHLQYKFLPEFVNILKDYDYEVELYYTEYKGHAVEIVKNVKGADLLLSIGGDGTFNEVITGNCRRNKRLVCAHIPVGTTNDVGTMMGYGKNMIRNLKMTLDGEIKKFDICSINGNPFVYVATIGKFADIPYETPRELKKKFGYLAYIKEGIKSFFDKTRLMDITYEIDGLEYRGLCSFIIISNANRIAGINDFYKDIKLDDNQFEVLLCNISKRRDIIKSLYFLTMYDIHKVPGIYFYKTNNLKIKFNKIPKKPWCIDGEMLNAINDSYDIKIDRNIQLMVPKRNIDKLFIEKVK